MLGPRGLPLELALEELLEAEARAADGRLALGPVGRLVGHALRVRRAELVGHLVVPGREVRGGAEVVVDEEARLDLQLDTVVLGVRLDRVLAERLEGALALIL